MLLNVISVVVGAIAQISSAGLVMAVVGFKLMIQMHDHVTWIDVRTRYHQHKLQFIVPTNALLRTLRDVKG